MGKWFDGNPLGKVLASICGGLLATELLLAVVWSLPAPGLDEDDLPEDTLEALELPVLAENEPIEAYAVIAERPVFNEDRRPQLMLAENDQEEEIEEEEEVEVPEVTLAGVVITPETRMVTLKHKDHPESLIAFEGQPLQGNFGSWHVSRIDEREITLSSGDGQEVDLKLEVNQSAIKAPEVAREARASEEAEVAESTEVAAADGDESEPLSRAEEIRQRIAERREELRRAAEEQQQENAAEEQAPQSYTSAIQSMMKRRSNKDQDEKQN
jgi:hypothetical protein